jgi:hypothetical protein
MPLDLGKIDGDIFSAANLDTIEAYVNAVETAAVATAATVATHTTELAKINEGAWTTWTPVVTQGSTPSLTVYSAVYMRVGRMITFEALVNITSTATAANDITISLPIAAKARYSGTNLIYFGVGAIYNANLGIINSGPLNTISGLADKVRIKATSSSTSTQFLGGFEFTEALTTGDTVSVSGTYEAETD